MTPMLFQLNRGINMPTTMDTNEIEKFSRIAEEWWDPTGKFAPLHRMNPLRVEYIVSRIRDSGIRSQANAESRILNPETVLDGLHLLDIGCGGGLVCEPMAMLGAQVTGIDASEKNIEIAKAHGVTSGLAIDYRCTTAEELVSSLRGTQATTQSTEPLDCHAPARARDDDALYDVVLALEIIEHVADVGLFIASVMKLVKPGGLAIFSTINRTPKAFALAIVGAEYILRWLPRGTHEWQKFIKPSELMAFAEAAGGILSDITGMVMNPLTFEWSLKPHDVSVNYLMTLTSNHYQQRNSCADI